jgi:hypothetical protein
MGMSFPEGLSDIMQKLPLVLKRFYGTALKYVGFIAFVAAIVFAIRKKYWLALGVFLLPFLSFLILMVKTGASIIGDHYYLITVIPSMAFITGFGIAQIPNKKIAAAILIVIGVEGLAAQIYDFRIRQPFKALADLEGIMDEVSQRTDLIAVNAEGHNPTAMYFTHRRGWVGPNSLLSHPSYLETITANGCKYIVVVKKLYGDLQLEYPVVHDSEYFRIYDIGKNQ